MVYCYVKLKWNGETQNERNLQVYSVWRRKVSMLVWGVRVKYFWYAPNQTHVNLCSRGKNKLCYFLYQKKQVILTGRSLGSWKCILMTISNSPHPVSVTSYGGFVITATDYKNWETKIGGTVNLNFKYSITQLHFAMKRQRIKLWGKANSPAYYAFVIISSSDCFDTLWKFVLSNNWFYDLFHQLTINDFDIVRYLWLMLCSFHEVWS